MRGAWILAILLILPSVAAFENVDLRVDGEKLRYASYGQTVEARLYFDPPSDADRVEVRYQGLEREQYQQLVVSTCKQTPGSCYIDVRFAAARQVMFTLVTGDAATIRDITWSLSQDTQAPEIREVAIGPCSGTRCAFSPDNRDLTFTVVEEAIAEVSVSSNNDDYRASCEHVEDITHTCTATIEGQQSIEATITVKDYAGNEQSTEVSLRYDATAPEPVEEMPVIGGNPDNLPGEVPILVSWTVSEAERAFITLESEALGQVTEECSRDREGELLCRASLTPNNDEQEGTIQVTVSDLAGNSFTESVSYQVYPSDESTQTNFWSVDANTRSRINADAWGVMAVHLPIELEFEALAPGAQIISLKVEQCQFDGAGGTIQHTKFPPFKDEAGEQNVLLQLKLPPQRDADDGASEIFREAEIICDTVVTTRAGNTVFTNPEQDSVRIQLDRSFTNLPSMTAAIDRKIEDSNEKILRNREMMRVLNGFAGGIMAVCGIQGGLAAGEGALISAAGVALGSVVGSPGAEPLRSSSDGLGLANDQIFKAMGRYCHLLTCEYVEGGTFGGFDGFNDALGMDSRAMDYFASAGGATQPQQLLDPYKSIVVATGMGCLPAIHYHVTNYMNLECVENYCLQNLETTGGNPADCSYVAGQYRCQMIAGQIYYAVPFTHVWDSVLGTLQGLVGNPIETAFGLGTVAICRAQDTATGIACKLAKMPQKVNLIRQSIQNMQRSYETLRLQSGVGRNYCESVLNLEPERGVHRPFNWNSYCGAGYATYNAGNEQYIISERGIMQRGASSRRVQPSDDPNAALEELSGSQLREIKNPEEELPGRVYDAAMQSYDDCKERLFDDFQGLGTNAEGQDLFTAADEAVNRWKEAERAYDDVEKDLRAEFQQQVAERRQQHIDAIDQQGEGSGASMYPGITIVPDEEGSEARIIPDDQNTVEVPVQPQDLDRPVIAGELRGVGAGSYGTQDLIDLQTAQYEYELEQAVQSGDVILSDALQEQMVESYRAQLRAEVDVEAQVAGGLDETIEEKRRELEAAKKEAKEKLAELEQARWKAELTGPNLISTSVASAQMWGEVSGLIGSLTGRRDGDVAVPGVPQSAILHWEQGVSALGDARTFAYDRTVGRMCSNKQEQPGYTEQAYVRSGIPAARISAQATQYELDGERTFDYIIDVYLNVPDAEGEQVDIIYAPSGSVVEDYAGIELDRPFQRTNGNAILNRTQTQHNEVCIRFEEPVERYFTIGLGGPEEGSRVLCTEIQVIRTQ